jgi:hypothetical protein
MAWDVKERARHRKIWWALRYPNGGLHIDSLDSDGGGLWLFAKKAGAAEAVSALREIDPEMKLPHPARIRIEVLKRIPARKRPATKSKRRGGP